MLTNRIKCVIINTMKERWYSMTKTKWIWVKTEQTFGNGFNEYISADGRYCKQVWFDGYEEIFEIS